MLRWLSAVVIAAVLLLSILLLLGWLLQNNAEQTTELVDQLKRAEQAEQQAAYQELLFEVNNKQAQQQAIIENLTCVTDSQCTVIAAPELSKHCLIAVNNIGAAKLAKLTSDQVAEVPLDCLTRLRQTKALCQLNQCGF